MFERQVRFAVKIFYSAYIFVSTQTASGSSTSSSCDPTAVFCDIELFDNIQTNMDKNITYKLVENIGFDDIKTAIFSLPNSELCTSCNKALYQSINETAAAYFDTSLDKINYGQSGVESAIDGKCGSDFIETAYSTRDVSIACSSSSGSFTPRRKFRFARN